MKLFLKLKKLLHITHSAGGSGRIRKERSDRIASKRQRPVRASLFRCPEAGATKRSRHKCRVIEKMRCKTPHFLLLAKSDFLAVAEAEGFEPSSRLLGYLISSQARYDHFDTLPYDNKEYNTIILRYQTEFATFSNKNVIRGHLSYRIFFNTRIYSAISFFAPSKSCSR